MLNELLEAVNVVEAATMEATQEDISCEGSNKDFKR